MLITIFFTLLIPAWNTPYIDTDETLQLKYGMTKEDVLDTLGYPLYVEKGWPNKNSNEIVWVYELRYGNQVLKMWKVLPHKLDDEGNLDISDEDEATFRQAVKDEIPKYAGQIWKQKMAFAVRNRQNARKNKTNLPVAIDS